MKHQESNQTSKYYSFESTSNSFQTLSATLPELNHHEVRIKVTYSSINYNDILLVEGHLTQDYFGSEIIGEVIGVGKDVGGRKVGEVVAVQFLSINNGKSHLQGFHTIIQVDVNHVVFLPTNLCPQKSASLLGAGLFAWNSLSNASQGDQIAIIGNGQLARLTLEFAKKHFQFHTTLFATKEPSNTVSKYDHFQIRSTENIKKFEYKYDLVIIADQIEAEQFTGILKSAKRGGKIAISIAPRHALKISVGDLVVDQKQIIGVKRGHNKLEQYVNMLHAAALHNIQSEVDVFDWKDFNGAWSHALKTQLAHSVVIKH